MEALSALRLMPSPDLRQMGLSKAAQDALAKAIPAGELQTLNPGPLSPAVGNISSGGGSFENTLGHFVSKVGGGQAVGNEAVGLLSGQDGSLHQAMIAMEEASLSFQLMVEVRNKLLESYQEVMRMQI